MHKVIVILYKILYQSYIFILNIISNFRCTVLFFFNGVDFKSFKCFGNPYIHVSMNAKCIIGSNFKLNNGVRYSDSGVNGKCRIEVRDRAVLNIGNDVGISDVTITCHEEIFISNNVLIGVGTQIRDTDNHSLNPKHHLDSKLDWENKHTAPIHIHDNVFIGAYSVVLKGVTIGKNAIIGANSVVTKDVPASEVWAGNPAKYLKTIVDVL
jgi:acetyltransferase-like isoleucine patch superfamily enzyme